MLKSSSSLPNTAKKADSNDADEPPLLLMTAQSETLTKSPAREEIVTGTLQTSSFWAPPLETEAEIAERNLQRGKWINPYDFLMCIISFTVGLGNIWRFPYLAFKHGGGSFLCAYTVFFVCVGVPMMLLEASIGQYFGLGVIEIWKIFPILKGVGIGIVIITVMVVAYYQVIICWSIFYLISSFTPEFPWENCSHYWNIPEECIASMDTSNNASGANISAMSTAATQFFNQRLLQKTSGFEDLGGVRWELVGIMVLLWLVVFLCVRKSLVRARSFIWVSALFPYFILFSLFTRALLLPGAFMGVKSYVMPRLDHLWSVEMWKDAGSQVFFSYSVASGGIISISAYNDFNQNVMKDVITTCFLNAGTSIVAGFTVFSTLGHVAHRMNITMEKLNSTTNIAGAGLAFKIYPEALVQIPPKHIWSVGFFVMLVLLGLSSLVCLVEAVYSSLEDCFPRLLRRHKRKCLALFCVFIVCMSSILMTEAATHWLHIFEEYGASGQSLLLIAFVELIGISWGYGAENIRHALHEMRGKRPDYFWVILWKYAGPLAIGATFVSVLFKSTAELGVGPKKPKWVTAVAAIISLSSMISLPAYAIYYVSSKEGEMSIAERIVQGLSTPQDINKERVDKFSKLIEH